MMKSLYVALPLLVGLALSCPSFAFSEKADSPKLAHMVFFTLKDGSKESVEKFVAACEKHLTKHEGTDYFSVGTRALDVEEPPSVKDFDVALHVVFANKDARDKYLKSERHDAFLVDARPAIEKVRVFDSYLAKP